MRGLSIGGIGFGILLLVTGVLVFLWSQNLLPFNLNIWAVCSLGLVALGVIVLGGVLWGRRMVRGRWRRWMMDWDQGEQRPPP